MKNSRDLILGEVVYIFIIYHIPYSWLYLSNGYDFIGEKQQYGWWFWSNGWIEEKNATRESEKTISPDIQCTWSCHGIVQGFQECCMRLGLDFKTVIFLVKIRLYDVSIYHITTKKFMFFKIRKEILLLRQGDPSWLGLAYSWVGSCAARIQMMRMQIHSWDSCQEPITAPVHVRVLEGEIVKLRNITDSRKITCDVCHTIEPFFASKNFYQNNRATVRIHKPLPTHLDESA